MPPLPSLRERVFNIALGIVSVSSRHVSVFPIPSSFSLISLKRRQFPFTSMAVPNTLGAVFILVGTHQESQNEVAHLKYFPHGCSVSPFRKKIIGYHGNQLPQHSMLSNYTGAALPYILHCRSLKSGMVSQPARCGCCLKCPAEQSQARSFLKGTISHECFFFFLKKNTLHINFL